LLKPIFYNYELPEPKSIVGLFEGEEEAGPAGKSRRPAGINPVK
jgi:hypothetical protein